MIKDQLIHALAEVTGVDNPQVEFAQREEFGDYSSNVTLVNKLSPEEVVAKLNKMPDLPARAEVKAGFINFWLKKEVLINSLKQIDIPKIGKGKTVVIDYSSPNIAKAFGIGHLRSTIIGQALYNLYKTLGYRVIGDNHLGDWGTQFGVLLAQIAKMSNDKSQVPNLTIDKLEKMYVEFHKQTETNPKLMDEARAWFKRLEAGDKEAREIWQKCVEVSLAEFNRIYKLLGVTIDYAYGESFYEGLMKEMLEDPKITRHLAEGERGAKVVSLPGMPPLMFLKSDGTTTYATRDLATLAFREKKWRPDIIIYEVGAEQTLHFRQVFAAAKMMGIIRKEVELVHVAHGLYLAPGGKKFSTRRGETVKLEDVLNEAIERAKKLGNHDDAVARAVGIGAIKYFDLMHHPGSNIVFDWEKMMNLEGNSGPYLQYTVARASSVLTKIKNQESRIKMTNQNLKINEEELKILRSLAQFSEIITDAAKNYSPNLLCNYLYDLASKFNTFYQKHRIINFHLAGGTNLHLEEGREGNRTGKGYDGVSAFRVSLTAAVARTLKTGLGLLGIESPERM